MKIKIDNNNIASVAGMLRKAIGKNSIGGQYFYPHAIKINRFVALCGLKVMSVEKSVYNLFPEVSIELDMGLCKTYKYIRVHNNTDMHNHSMFSGYRAFLINEGDVIEFKHNTILIKQQSPVFSDDKCLHKIDIL